LLKTTRSYPEMVGDMSRVTLNQSQVAATVGHQQKCGCITI